ncbi:MAG: hypothetical protein ACTHJQ_01395 [Rhizobiaceae bacterium]
MPAALYLVKYHGGAGAGGAVLYIGNGVIAGADVAEARYDGSYTTDAAGALSGNVTLTAKVSAQLVTGATLPAGQSITIPFILPANFGNGQQFQFNVAGSNVPATFEKIIDLP